MFDFSLDDIFSYETVSNIATFIGDTFDDVIEDVSEVFSDIGDFAEGIWDDTTDFANEIYEGIFGGLDPVSTTPDSPSRPDFVSNEMQVSDTFKSYAPTLSGAASQATQQAPGLINSVGGGLLNAGKSVVNFTKENPELAKLGAGLVAGAYQGYQAEKQLEAQQQAARESLANQRQLQRERYDLEVKSLDDMRKAREDRYKQYYGY